MEEEELIYPKSKKRLREQRRWRVTYSDPQKSRKRKYFHTYLMARIDIWMLCSGGSPVYETATILDQRPERPML